MDYDFAADFGERCAAADIALSVHAPIAGFMGHAERGKKLNMAVGMLDHSAGIAKAAGAELVVFHPGLPARPDARGRDRRGRRAARRAARAARGKGSRRAVRDRGDGPRARARLDRRRLRDRLAARLGAPGDRLRAHARDLRRGVPVGRAVRRGARAGGRGDRAGRAVPHPLLGHPVREPQRDEAPALRRGHAPRRAAARGAGAVRAAGDGHLRVADRRSRRRRSRRSSARS